jgi:hypothetical protein
MNLFEGENIVQSEVTGHGHHCKTMWYLLSSINKTYWKIPNAPLGSRWYTDEWRTHP